MTRKQLVEQIQTKRSYLTVGLDTDISKIPKHLQSHPDAIFEFNKAIIDATHDLCVAYKINTAFYEALGLKGWEAMEKTGKENPDFWDIKKYLPAETRTYVMNFITLNVLFHNYEKFSDNTLSFKPVKVKLDNNPEQNVPDDSGDLQTSSNNKKDL